MTKSEPTIYSCYCAAYALALTGGEVMMDMTWSRQLIAAVATGAAHGFDDRSSNRRDGIKTQEWVITEVYRLLEGTTAIIETKDGDR